MPSRLDITAVIAHSLEYEEVLSAFTLAQPGDRIQLPAGEARWSEMLDVALPEGCSLFGAGDLSIRGGGDRTIIYDDCPDDESLLKIGTCEGRAEIAGFTVRGGSGQLKNNRLISIGGNSKDLSVHHLSVNTSTYTTSSERKGGAIRPTGHLNGVIWECDFHAYQGVDVWMPTYGGAKYGDGAFAAALNLGSSDFVFIEDCDFTSMGGSICDNGPGGRLVVRYCRCNHLNTHGTGFATRNRGVRAFEFYNNLICNDTGDTKSNAVSICGGSGVVWGNTCEGEYKVCVSLKIHRNNNDTYGQKPVPQGWGYAGTNFNGTGSPWDGNDDPATGYPALDQPGRGHGDLLMGNFPDAVNTAADGPQYPNQQPEPIYIWANEWEQVPNNSDSKYLSASTKYFQEGREYLLAPMPDYEPYAYPHPLRG